MVDGFFIKKNYKVINIEFLFASYSSFLIYKCIFLYIFFITLRLKPRTFYNPIPSLHYLSHALMAMFHYLV